MSLIVVLKMAMVLSIVLMLFALALRAKVTDLYYLVTHWRLGLGAFVSMFVLVPAAAILMVWFFDLNRAVEIAIVAIAFSPLPPVLPGKQLKAGAQASYVTGLLFGATLVAIVIAPIGISLASRLLHIDAQLAPMSVAQPLIVSILFPVVLGLIAAPLLGHRVPAVSDVLGKIGSIILGVVMLCLAVLMFPAMWKLVGDGTLAVLAVMAIVGLVGGYLLGGPDLGNKGALALASSNRHPGVAIAIATHSLAHTEFVPAAVVLSLLVSTVLGGPVLSYLGKRQAGTPQDE